MTDHATGKTIDDVRRFWSTSPLFVGEGSGPPGSREWFEQHESVYMRDCLAGEPSAIFTAGLARDARILDVGCGPGFWVRFFARRGFTRVTGCDLTEAAVDLTRVSLELFGLAATVEVGDAEALPYADQTFDHVNCQGVVHHTPAPRRAVEEFARVLRPGGTICLSVYRRAWLLRHPRALRIVARLAAAVIGLEGRGRDAMLASGDAEEIVRMYDGRENPIGRAYTEGELQTLVGGAFDVECVERMYFPGRALPVRPPAALHPWLGKRFGMMVVVRARKRHES